MEERITEALRETVRKKNGENKREIKKGRTRNV